MVSFPLTCININECVNKTILLGKNQTNSNRKKDNVLPKIYQNLLQYFITSNFMDISFNPKRTQYNA